MSRLCAVLLVQHYQQKLFGFDIERVKNYLGDGGEVF